MVASRARSRFAKKRLDEIESNIGAYAGKYTSYMKRLRAGNALKVDLPIYGCPRDKRPKSETIEVLHSYVEEVQHLHTDFRDAPTDQFSVWRPVQELESELPSSSRLKRKFAMSLSCDAAMERLLEVVSYQIMRRPLRRYSDQEIENALGAEEFINSFDTRNVVRRLVSKNLEEVFSDELQGAIPRLIEHIRILCHLPVDKIHTALVGEFKDVSALKEFKDELDDGFGRWLDETLLTCKTQLFSMVDETQKTLVVNIDKMFANLLDPRMQLEQETAPNSFDIGQMPPPSENLGFGPVTVSSEGDSPAFPDVTRIMKFLEAGSPELLKDDVNDSASRYFYIYKGMLVLEMQSKVRTFVAGRLSLDSGPDDPLVTRICAVADEFRKNDHKAVIEEVLGRTGLVEERDARKVQIQKIKEVVHTLRQRLRNSSL